MRRDTTAVRLIQTMRRPLIGRSGTAEFVSLVLFGLFLAAIEAFDRGQLPASAADDPAASAALCEKCAQGDT